MSFDQDRTNRTEPHPMTSLLSMLLLIALVLSIFVVPMERVLFHPLTYRQAVASQQPDQRMVEIFADLVTREPDTLDPQMVRSVETMSREELEALFNGTFPAGWAQNQSNRVIEGLMGYLNGQSEDLRMPVDLTPLKNALDAHSQELAVGIVSSWPPCSAEVLLDMGVQALNGQLTEIPYCQPNEIFRPLVEQLMSGSIRFTASSLPQFIDLADAVPIDENPAWWPFFRGARTMVLVAPLFAVVLMVLILALSGLRSAGVLLSVGQAFLVAAVTAVVLLVIAGLIFTPLLRFVLDSPLVLLPDAVTGFLLRVLQVAGIRVGVSVVVWSGLAAMIGLSLWVLSLLVRQAETGPKSR